MKVMVTLTIRMLVTKSFTSGMMVINGLNTINVKKSIQFILQTKLFKLKDHNNQINKPVATK